MRTRVSLTNFLIDERRKHPQASGDFNSLILDVALACKRIARDVAYGALHREGATGAQAAQEQAGGLNVQNEVQLWQDLAANEHFVQVLSQNPSLAGMVSEEMAGPIWLHEDERAKYLLAFDPLDGSSNVDVNVSVGSIFSILRVPQKKSSAGKRTVADFLQPGVQQVAAGYAIYGPSTMLVVTVGSGVYVFSLDPELSECVLSHPQMRIPEHSNVFAINASNSRFWAGPVRRYVNECLAGASGPRGQDFNMRWIASLVAEAHRILSRGGVFLYPQDTRTQTRQGRLRMLYEVSPIAWLIEQAGGAASNGREAVLPLAPQDLHQRMGFVFGSASEVRRIENYHAQDHAEDFDIPLFKQPSLFRFS